MKNKIHRIKMVSLACEFYKCFWNLKGPLSYEVLLTLFDNQELLFLQRLFLITILFQKRDKKFLEIPTTKS